MTTESHITVGVPVYHGWDFVAGTLQTIQRQTYKDFTVLISVDGNDARSAEACASFLADSRFRLVMQKEQLGWAGNINWLFEQAAGDFFVYNQQDDRTDPIFLETLLATAKREPGAASVYSDVLVVGARNELVSEPSIRGTPFARVLAHIEQLNHASFRGVIRLQAIRAAGPLPENEYDSYAADTVWVAKLARWGDLVSVPQALYFKHIDPESVHGKWYRWERKRRREPWIGLLMNLLEIGQTVADTDEQRASLVTSITAKLAPPPDGWAFYPTVSREERQQLITEFWERAEYRGLCKLHRDAQGRPINVMFGPKLPAAIAGPEDGLR